MAVDPRLRMRIEVEALHELLAELDYYRLLQVERACSPDDIGNAFRRESRRLHPDRMSTLGDGGLAAKANDVYRLVNEGYRVLKDPEQRARYDQLLAAGSNRMNDEAKDAAKADKKADDPETAATHPKSERYWKMALRDLKEKSYKAAVMNIKFALTFEPTNETFKEHLKVAEEALAEADKKKEKNPYKLRIM
jgi:curved DNA-binding protein CbpA